MVTPALAAGDALIFDYRTIHRGLASKGAHARPVAYFVCTTRSDGLVDEWNWGRAKLLGNTGSELFRDAFRSWNDDECSDGRSRISAL